MRDNSNRAKVAAIRQAWDDVLPKDRTITYKHLEEMDLLAQVAINVLTDWHKHDA